jgi:uncharacterized protein YfiM (DUF2279 family)
MLAFSASLAWIAQRTRRAIGVAAGMPVGRHTPAARARDVRARLGSSIYAWRVNRTSVRRMHAVGI